jgi:hypothetical protein
MSERRRGVESAATAAGHQGERARESRARSFFAATRSLAGAVIEETRPFGPRSRFATIEPPTRAARFRLPGAQSDHRLADDRAFGEPRE